MKTTSKAGITLLIFAFGSFAITSSTIGQLEEGASTVTIVFNAIVIASFFSVAVYLLWKNDY